MNKKLYKLDRQLYIKPLPKGMHYVSYWSFIGTTKVILFFLNQGFY